jgi:Raf kinase inhibitor-like YbhB/YbcL family protein
MDDPDAPGAEPFVHWLVYNIPASVTSLPEHLPSSATLPEAGGALQGRTSAGSMGYFGPRPPKRHQPHHYHFRLYALDGVLPLEPGVDRGQLARAMEGHTLAETETMGTYGFVSRSG